jgi:hypothetical protein
MLISQKKKKKNVGHNHGNSLSYTVERLERVW